MQTESSSTPRHRDTKTPRYHLCTTRSHPSASQPPILSTPLPAALGPSLRCNTSSTPPRNITNTTYWTTRRPFRRPYRKVEFHRSLLHIDRGPFPVPNPFQRSARDILLPYAETIFKINLTTGRRGKRCDCLPAPYILHPHPISRLPPFFHTRCSFSCDAAYILFSCPRST